MSNYLSLYISMADYLIYILNYRCNFEIKQALIIVLKYFSTMNPVLKQRLFNVKNAPATFIKFK